ncbi:hypothetical protein GPOL_c44880 [Gordonia polyisoprenivorans VH2]|uniref:Uncharacterized protein n=1 Tax=Gordonia polyisoprenivorans (strain DSM 44266 / VH2) TaxID=1112204 RepID=H6MXG5_GORPV|nr:hypothetical protein [Gordonia polyisoprenivorans]AFA75490.1 hypothetical protein GPOL_c44880 [Gordonia polyisoprenivorans VH2]UZF55798.1 hypothetical protein LH935_24350 [Gordonia polyisoprenivorans]
MNMPAQEPIPKADEADWVEQTVEVTDDSGVEEYPYTPHDDGPDTEAELIPGEQRAPGSR